MQAKPNKAIKMSASFYRLLFSSIEGSSQNNPHTNKYVVVALAMLCLWILLSACGMQSVFYRIGQIQRIADTWSSTTEAFEEFKKSPEFVVDKWQNADQEPKVSPYVQVTVANLGTLLVWILFLGVMARYGSNKAGWMDATVVAALCSVPLTAGMLASTILFKMADGITVAYLPTILYLVGIFLLVMAIMTSFIILYVDVLAILGLSKWKRYFTTTLSVFLVLGVFAGISRMMM